MINLNKPFTCDHCHKSFAREQTLVHHSCEPKRRHESQNQPHVKLALRAYQMWWAHLHPRDKSLVTHQQFAVSQLYAAFVRIGSWCLEQQVQEFDAWVNYQLRSQTPVDRWCDVNLYHAYVKDLLTSESHLQALKRSLATAEHWAEVSGHAWVDLFRKGHVNVLCGWIQQGRISAWMLYNAPSAVEFLSRCTPEQLNLIQQVIPHHLWRIRFMRMASESDAVRHILTETGM